MKRRLINSVLALVLLISLVSTASGVSPDRTLQDSISPVTSKDVVYQIITDRFYDGDTNNNIPDGFDAALFDGTGNDLKLYQGGDWQGIIDQIPYLKGMGITAIWISAPYENRDDEIIDYQSDGSINKWTSFHGYHVRNYFATNKHFGMLQEFELLRDQLHANGLKLVIDFVTNHTSRWKNPTAQYIAEDGCLYEPDRMENGEFAFDLNGEPYDYNQDGLIENLVVDPNNDVNGWFHGLGDRGTDDSRFGFRHKELGSLADFSQENESVVKYLEEAALFWSSMGVDGMRHDATLHMNPAFVKGLKDAIDSNGTITHFGEFFIGRPDPKYDEYVYFPKQTGVSNLDFEFYRTATSVFGDFSSTMQDFGEMLTYTQVDYEFPNQAVTFLDNHDVTRFGYIQQNHKPYNAALAVLMTSRGIPNIYYGTEQYVSATDASDVAGRVFMERSCEFDTASTAYQVIATLANLRQENNAIAFGETRILYSNDDILVYERKFYDEVVVVAVNRQPDKTLYVPTITTSLPNGYYVDALNGLLYGDGVDVINSGAGNQIAGIELEGGEVSVWAHEAYVATTPQLGDVVSTMGRAGNTVFLYGTGFNADVSVYFDAVEATIISKSETMIETVVPTGTIAGYNEIRVTHNAAASNPIMYKVLSGDQNQIVFHVNAETTYGENIYIVGDIPELGSWDPDFCTEAMMTPNYPEWFLPVSVPSGTDISFKFIKKDTDGNITWESGANRTITSSQVLTGSLDSPVYSWQN